MERAFGSVPSRSRSPAGVETTRGVSVAPKRAWVRLAFGSACATSTSMARVVGLGFGCYNDEGQRGWIPSSDSGIEPYNSEGNGESGGRRSEGKRGAAAGRKQERGFPAPTPAPPWRGPGSGRGCAGGQAGRGTTETAPRGGTRPTTEGDSAVPSGRYKDDGQRGRLGEASLPTTGSTPTERRGYKDEGRTAVSARGYSGPRFNIAPTQAVQ